MYKQIVIFREIKYLVYYKSILYCVKDQVEINPSCLNDGTKVHKITSLLLSVVRVTAASLHLTSRQQDVACRNCI